MQQLSPGQANPEVPLNENAETLQHQQVYGKRQPATSALTWGYYGGRWGGFSIADGTLTLTDAATNYITVTRAGGAIAVSTNATAWDNTGDHARVYKITTAAGAVSAVEDHRAGPGGVHGAAGSGAGGTAGRHSIAIMASGITPSASGGCGALEIAATASNKPDLIYLPFDASTQEFAQFAIPMPKKWNLGTVSARFLWSHSSTTTNFGVAWQIQAVAVSNDDTISVDYGTAQVVADTGGTTSDLYVSDETSAVTIAGTPAAEDTVFFRVARVPSNGGDTMAIDARLHGVVLYVNTNAETDA